MMLMENRIVFGFQMWRLLQMHLGVRVNGKWEDSFDYINATLEDEGNNKLSISTPCDD